MQLASVGPFKILRELGRGGMGEVYLATDTRLDRQVAIKALPAHLVQDPDRLARFQREAKLLASLNHPGIGAIYGLEESDGHQYLILEYIEGETLAERLVSGAIPIDEALSMARQVAEALETAHEKGVIHRDLKPANVMVTSDGVVKVLDFGLARTAEGAPSSSNVVRQADSPTVIAPPQQRGIPSPTIPGVILGTAGYMSPEQARGKPVDKRSDIFSFGCVLYEMLTGVCPFPGESATDSLGAILHREPDWSLLPANTPVRVRELLRNCLAKDRRNRTHDIGDARLEIERAIAGQEWTSASARSPAGTSSRLLVAGALGAVIACAAAAGWFTAHQVKPVTPPAPAQTLYVSTTIQDKPSFNGLAGISPDSKFLVYTAYPELPADSEKPEGLLMVRRLDRDETTVIEGTEGARSGELSPDGRWIVFAQANDRARTKMSLKRVALDQGRPAGKPELICALPTVSEPEFCWASDREIVFSSAWERSIYSVPATGGEPRLVLRDETPQGIESWAELCPLIPGQSILATRWAFVGQKVKVNTEVIELASGKRTLVLPDSGSSLYIPDATGGGGHLVGMKSTQTSLVAVRFDPGSMRTVGEPTTVWSGGTIGAFRISAGGMLAIVTRSVEVPDRRLAWIDEKGQPQPIPGATRSFGEIAVSPDGKRVLVGLDLAETNELVSEVWVQDLARRTSTRISVQGAMIGMVWSPDGQRIAYGLAGDGAFSVWQRPSDGSGVPVKLCASPDNRTLIIPIRWSPDGKTLAMIQVDMSTDNPDVYLYEHDAGSEKGVPKPYLKSPASEVLAGFSPDGKWALIGSSQSGRDELYVQRFTGDGEADAKAGRVQVSTGGASSQATWWSPDGKEIRYIGSEQRVMSVQVKTDPTFSAAEPTVLYSIKDLKTRSITFAPDGRLMAVLQGESEKTTRKVDLVINFLNDLRAKLPQHP